MGTEKGPINDCFCHENFVEDTQDVFLIEIFSTHLLVIQNSRLDFILVLGRISKTTYQKSMKGVIGTHFEFKELYP